MGPILEESGVEQGAKLSADEFQLVSNCELDAPFLVNNSDSFPSTSLSSLGFHLGPISVPTIGIADDTALLSTNPFEMQSLLNLSLNFCKESSLSLVPGKTKLSMLSISVFSGALDHQISLH